MEPGGEVRVSISVMEYGQVGALVEVLPMGFVYVTGSAISTADDGSTDTDVLVEDNGRKLTFTFLGGDVTSVAYTARAMTAPAGSHPFSGELIDDDRRRHEVGGATGITVRAGTMPGGPMAERSFSMMPAGPGAEVTVTVAASNYGPIGVVMETLPAGFTYVDGSGSPAGVMVDGQELTFTLLEADATVSYRVTAAGAAGTYDFSGDLVDDRGISREIGGATQLEVKGAEGTRSFSVTRIARREPTGSQHRGQLLRRQRQRGGDPARGVHLQRQHPGCGQRIAERPSGDLHPGAGHGRLQLHGHRAHQGGHLRLHRKTGGQRRRAAHHSRQDRSRPHGRGG